MTGGGRGVRSNTLTTISCRYEGIDYNILWFFGGVDPDFSIAWWCPPPVPKPPVSAPSFLPPADREAAARELDALEKVGAAATWFCREALAFSTCHPDDPRAPEFLARAVHATREGCADAETKTLSKAAFRHLHVRYPESQGAKRTKYWFEGRGWYPPS